MKVHPSTHRNEYLVMAAPLLLTLDSTVVKAQVSLGQVGGIVSTSDSSSGNALMILITNPFGPKVEIASCIGERATGWLGRGRQRFVIPLNGLPYRFGEDGDRCLAWANTRYLPSLDGLVQVYLRDSNGNDWPVGDLEAFLRIRQRLDASR
jgi:hypothetical protein